MLGDVVPQALVHELQEEKNRFVVFEADSQVTSGAHRPFEMSDAAVGIRPVRTYVELAKTVASNVKDRVQTLGRKLDSAVQSGTGMAPSAVFSNLADTLLPRRDRAAQGATRADPVGVASAWTRMCVQNADLCLLVGQAHTPPGLSDTERNTVFKQVAPNAVDCRPVDHAVTPVSDLQLPSPRSPRVPHSGALSGVASAPQEIIDGAVYLPRTLARKELILLHHDPHRRPQATRNWLRPRRVTMWHHVRTWADEYDFDRVARHICGQARALVLSGGGSRGLAHLGVLQTLEERNFPVDVVGGTSQGAFMGACYAMTLSSSA